MTTDFIDGSLFADADNINIDIENRVHGRHSQSLNRASKANPAIGLVSCRSDRHAMNAFFAEALLG